MIERAVALGFSAIAIADHDTLAGVPEAQAHADKLGIEYLPATEISARFGPAEIHILGYGVRLDNPELNEELKALCDSRANRAEQIVDKLNKLGVEVLLDKIHERANGGAIGRLHIAQEIHTKGYTRTVQQGFDKYIGIGRPAYVEKGCVSCEHAIELIHGADGLAVLAHPGLGRTPGLVATLIGLPLDGIEVYHSKHSAGQVAVFSEIATERGLLITGGSDCHGEAKNKPEIGNVRTPYRHYELLRNALRHVHREN